MSVDTNRPAQVAESGKKKSAATGSTGSPTSTAGGLDTTAAHTATVESIIDAIKAYGAFMASASDPYTDLLNAHGWTPEQGEAVEQAFLTLRDQLATTDTARPAHPAAPVLDTAPLASRLAALGSLPPFVIDTNDGGDLKDPLMEGNIEGELVYFRDNDCLPLFATEDPGYLDEQLNNHPISGTPATLAREYFRERAQRRQIAALALRYAQAVNADEAKRNAIESTTAATNKQTSADHEPRDPSVSVAVDTAINHYYDTFGPEGASETADWFFEAINQTGVVPSITEAFPASITEAIGQKGGVTIAEHQERIRWSLANRRAYYETVRVFINDPMTWAQLDAQDAALPDVPTIAAAMRTAGIAVYEDTLTAKGGAS